MLKSRILFVFMLVICFCCLALPVAVKAKSGKFEKIMSEARQLAKKKQNLAALKLYQKAVELRPRSSQAHAELGGEFFELGYIEKATQEELKAIELNKNNVDARLKLGWIYYGLGQYQQAADQFRIGKRINPKKFCNCGPIGFVMKAYPAKNEGSQRKPGQGPAPQ